MTVKSLGIRNRSYYFWDDTIYIDNFDPKLLKLDKKESLLGIDIYYIGYVTKKDGYNINSVNPLYLVIPSVEEYVENIVNTGDRNLIITAVNNNYDYGIIAEPIESIISKNIVISSNVENKKV